MKKLENQLVKNSIELKRTSLDLKMFQKIRDIMIGKKEVELKITVAQHVKYSKYAPVTSVEVERTFYKLKMVLSDRLLSLSI